MITNLTETKNMLDHFPLVQNMFLMLHRQKNFIDSNALIFEYDFKY